MIFWKFLIFVFLSSGGRYSCCSLNLTGCVDYRSWIVFRTPRLFGKFQRWSSLQVFFCFASLCLLATGLIIPHWQIQWRHFLTVKNKLFFFNRREVIADAIIGLFFRFVKIFVTTIWQSLQIRFFFICSCNFNWIACVTSFCTLIRESFLFI